MLSLTDEQALRLECLKLCGGSVSEAKNAYFWISQRQEIAPGLSAASQMALSTARGVQERKITPDQALREHIAMEKMYAQNAPQGIQSDAVKQQDSWKA